MSELVWDGSLYRKFNFLVSEDVNALPKFPNPPFLLEKVLVDWIAASSSYSTHNLCSFLTELFKRTPKLRSLELSGNGTNLEKDFLVLLDQKEWEELALSDFCIGDGFSPELDGYIGEPPCLRQVTSLQLTYVASDEVIVVSDSCKKLKSFSAKHEDGDMGESSWVYFFSKLKSTLVSVNLKFQVDDQGTSWTMEATRALASCIHLQELSLEANEIPLAPLGNLKQLKTLKIVTEEGHDDT